MNKISAIQENRTLYVSSGDTEVEVMQCSSRQSEINCTQSRMYAVDVLFDLLLVNYFTCRLQKNDGCG